MAENPNIFSTRSFGTVHHHAKPFTWRPKHKKSSKIKEVNHAKFGSQSNNLASIIRGFKSSVTMQARKLNVDFAWQARFHDRIIRDENELENIIQYIYDNPIKG